jgi:hypothetical protein
VSARSGTAFGAALPGAGATSIQAANTMQLSNHHACRGMSTSFPLRSECKALGFSARFVIGPVLGRVA